MNTRKRLVNKWAPVIAAALLFLGSEVVLAEGAADHQEPRIVVSQEPGGQVRWIVPGPRCLDPVVFGTSENPKMTGHDIGVAVENRATNEDGTAFPQTTVPTPFSDPSQTITGQFSMTMVDRPPQDTSDSQDEASGEFRFTSPGGENSYG